MKSILEYKKIDFTYKNKYNKYGQYYIVLYKKIVS